MMPLMPATRPLRSTNIVAAMPMMTPPISAGHGVKADQSMDTVYASFAVLHRRHGILRAFCILALRNDPGGDERVDLVVGR